MKIEIDSLMESRNLDAMLVMGPGQHNPAMVYLTGGGHLTSAYLIQKRGSAPVLFHFPMERDEAARTGLQTRDIEEFGYQQLLSESGGNILQTLGVLFQRIFSSLGLTSGRVAVYGLGEAGNTIALQSQFHESLPGIEWVGEFGRSMLLTAMETKSEDEVQRIRRMGKITTEVIGQVADFLTSHRSDSEILIKTDGTPLTIGDVKRRINLWLAERGADNPEGTIFAIAHDSGVPHSTGNAADYLRLGQTIVFDIFPRETGGGYYYDITRTWCLGYATDEAQALYEDVRFVYQEARKALRLDTPCRDYQLLACDLFEKRGHPTLRSHPASREGYVHSLGHGLGLHVHELPMFRATAPDEERLRPGVVVTVEPGLYYPERGLGMRLEDTVYARPDGSFETLAEFPHDLVLPMRH